MTQSPSKHCEFCGEGYICEHGKCTVCELCKQCERAALASLRAESKEPVD